MKKRHIKVFSTFFCPFFSKWLRGRDLHPRPLGYECNFLVACPFVFWEVVAVRCLPLATLIEVFRPKFRPNTLLDYSGDAGRWTT